MKTKLIPVLVCVCIALPAAAEPLLYGKANVALQLADEGDASTTELVSNASRLGVKGDLEIEGGLTAIYQAEFEVYVDDGAAKDGQTFSQRNVFVGLAGDFGLARAGRFDTPLKEAQNKIDLFNDLEGDIKAMITESDNRAPNIVAYTSPALGPVKVNVALIASEVDGVSDGLSSSVLFEQNDLYLALAYDNNVEGEDISTVRAVAQYNIAKFQLGGLYEQMDNGAVSADGVLVSAQYTLDKLAVKVQLGQSDINEQGGQSLSLGADYKLAKNLKVFGYYTSNESDQIVGGAGETTNNDYLGAGVELKF